MLGRVGAVGAGAWYGLKIAGGDDGVVVWTAEDGFDGVVAVAVQHVDRRPIRVGFPPVSPVNWPARSQEMTREL